MKKHLLFLTALFISGKLMVSAQTAPLQKMCGNEAAWQQAITIDPTLVQRRRQAEAQMEQYIQNMRTSRTASEDTVRIIPVVFHILQEGGEENISDAQVIDQVRVLNEDYRRLNADTSRTFEAFKPVAADPKIEFRLATIDPYGHCSAGIDRIYTHRANQFNDYGKAIVDWPSDKYLNIWVAKSIGVSSEKGIVIGYAQFPVQGFSGTGGVVIQENYAGTIGSALNTPESAVYKGRDATHEIGHYLNLIHTWGDADCGDDKCEDTPTQQQPDFSPYQGACPPDPNISCGNDGDMWQNYMDYSDGDCKNIFTQDQKLRMRTTLDVARYSIWQPSNLAATGTADPYIYPAACAPAADFLPVHTFICDSGSVQFSSNTSNGTPDSWQWSFPGGTPSLSTLSNPVVQYSAAGSYPVTLVVSNAQGRDSITRSNVVVVSPPVGKNIIPFTDNFEDSQSFSGDWLVFNDDGGPAWQRTSRAAHSGTYSLSVQNYETTANTAPNSVKEFYTPTFDFSGISEPLLQFYLSYGQQYSGNTDSLSIKGSTDCGVTWDAADLISMAGGALAGGSGGLQPDNYAPASYFEWQLVQIQLPSFYAGQKNVRFRFRFTTGILSNNIYIDDIAILNGTVGITEANNAFAFEVSPNPSSGSFIISYAFKRAEDLIINMYDMEGRLIKQISNKHTEQGSFSQVVDSPSFNLAPGVYLLKMITADGIATKKLIIND